MRLGVIADDFTGATDIASFLVNNGMATVQFNGCPTQGFTEQADALVVSLKTRSCPTDLAVSAALNALRWLQQQGCSHFYFKYCSTFDSTERGNIGPVTDALLLALDETLTIISPALPVNGRSVYKGYLFVGDVLLAESGMRNHPITPMRDSYLPRLMDAQASGKCGVIDAQSIERGVQTVKQQLIQRQAEGFRYVVLDALSEQHLITQGAAVADMKLVTGGSGLAIGIARQWQRETSLPPLQGAMWQRSGRSVVLSGSCSERTNEQVAHYRQLAPSQSVDVEPLLAGELTVEAYAHTLAEWVLAQPTSPAPLVYATSAPEVLHVIQQRFGVEKSSSVIEALFSRLAGELCQAGIGNFIVAGGETSSAITQTLNVHAFHIGPSVSPGVPWIKAINQPVYLLLKSGNFGDINFFARAQHQEFTS
ncbi:membrane protein [[Pantoea] beijingensis]|uniref:3-oxo-tetronate kinase n=1 Tax=[Pantoea] beijingensis TaxID=1324864 RepID=A0A443IB33_9GAMM|nr:MULTISPECIES: 3-oxo-tetronate kinase [Erwiniaceae]RWR01451.1 membrane protein [[Pantoea] beijingensis]